MEILGSFNPLLRKKQTLMARAEAGDFLITDVWVNIQKAGRLFTGIHYIR